MDVSLFTWDWLQNAWMGRLNSPSKLTLRSEEESQHSSSKRCQVNIKENRQSGARASAGVWLAGAAGRW
jgi:hypothetical protein